MLETSCIKLKLKPGSLHRVRVWAVEMFRRNSEAIESLRDAGIYVQSIFLDSNREGDFLVYYVKAKDLGHTDEALRNSLHAIDTYHQEFLQEVQDSQKDLKLLVDMDRTADLPDSIYALETSCVKLKLKANKGQRVNDWAATVTRRMAEALDAIRDEGVFIESVFFDTSKEGDFLLYYMKAASLERAVEAAKRSTHAVDTVHREFIQEVQESQKELKLLVDLDRTSELASANSAMPPPLTSPAEPVQAPVVEPRREMPTPEPEPIQAAERRRSKEKEAEAQASEPRREAEPAYAPSNGNLQGRAEGERDQLFLAAAPPPAMLHAPFGGPFAVDQAIRQAIAVCWQVLQAQEGSPERIEQEIQRLVRRALDDLKEDVAAFGFNKGARS